MTQEKKGILHKFHIKKCVDLYKVNIILHFNKYRAINVDLVCKLTDSDSSTILARNKFIEDIVQTFEAKLKFSSSRLNDEKIALLICYLVVYTFHYENNL